MDRFDKAVATLIIITALCVSIVVTTITLYSDYLISKAIEHGANPIQAKHAFKQTSPAEDVLAWQSLKE